MLPEWEPLGRIDAAELAPTRLALHWAAQIVAAAGATLLEPRPDASHAALVWLDAARAFAGEPAPSGLRAILWVDSFSLGVASAGGAASIDRFGLAGRTMSDGLAWLGTALAKGGRVTELVRPAHDLPARPEGEGAPFRASPDALVELGNWYANASRLLAQVAKAPGASPVRAWPHHFDIATLIAIDKSAGEHARSIGVGMSPGDGSYAEPYWYVTPWPYPESRTGPTLGAGHWHTNGWFGAVLTATELFDAPPSVQAARARAFLQAARGACASIVNGSG